MVHLQTRKNLSKQGKTFPKRKKTPTNKEKPFQTRKNTSKQGKTFPKRKNLSKQEKTPTNKGNTFRARETPFKQGVGVSRQGKAVVSDGGYGVIGGGYCLLVWGDAEETKGNGRRRWRGVGPAGRPSLFSFGVSVILKI